MKTKKIILFLLCIVFLSSFCSVALAQVVNFTNPLSYNTVEGVLAGLLDKLQGIIVIISIIFIIIGAIFYITSAGNEKRITTAKAAISAAVIGLALGIAAPTFLRETADILGWGVPAKIRACDFDGNSVIAPGPSAEDTCYAALTTSTSGTTIATNTLNFLLSIVGIIAIIMLVIGGMMYMTAAGDEDRIDKGKKMVTYSIIGIIVALAALVLVRQVATLF